MQCRPALTFVVGAIFGATVVLVTDDKRMSRIRPLRRVTDVGPTRSADAARPAPRRRWSERRPARGTLCYPTAVFPPPLANNHARQFTSQTGQF